MKKIPHARDVDQALRAARTGAKAALKGLNQVAGETMAKGRYDEAQALASKAKDVLAIDAEIEALRKRWKALLGTGRRAAKQERKPQTPLWEFYQPVLKALVELGGTAPRREIEPIVGRLMKESLQPGDFDVMARGWQRWQRSVFLTHKHLLAEGWIEKNGQRWVITTAGRRTAKAAASSLAKRGAS